MKTKINKQLLTVFFLVLLSSGFLTQQAQAQEDQTELVRVYYFHFNTRCATCKAVESEAQQDVKELFGNDVSFAAYNLDEKEGEAKGKELGVDSQSLIVVKGTEKIDLTNEGFLYALTDPEKFRQIIEEKIAPLL